MEVYGCVCPPVWGGFGRQAVWAGGDHDEDFDDDGGDDDVIILIDNNNN